MIYYPKRITKKGLTMFVLVDGTVYVRHPKGPWRRLQRGNNRDVRRHR